MTPEISDSRKIAEAMANLTCDLAQTCNDKESYFASMFNLTPAEFKCLRLFNKVNSLSIKEITSRLKITPGRVTHILTSLEDKHFITRKIDELDKRNVIVHLTHKSEPFIKNLNDSHINLHEEILEKIPSEKRANLIALLEDLLRALKLWSNNKY
jgi:DNA-binding MarR family transcriptional regulator